MAHEHTIILGEDLEKSNAVLNECLSHRTQKGLSSKAEVML